VIGDLPVESSKASADAEQWWVTVRAHLSPFTFLCIFASLREFFLLSWPERPHSSTARAFLLTPAKLRLVVSFLDGNIMTAVLTPQFH